MKKTLLWSVSATLALFVCALQAHATETVQIKSLNDDVIDATISKPDGEGPFPAIVVMHSCGGRWGQGTPQDFWADFFHDHGYVVIRPDSFTSRGFKDGVCSVPIAERGKITHTNRTKDALATLAYLRTLPYVDGKHVGIFGESHGGSTILGVMAGQEKLVGKGNGFVSAVSVYPACNGAPFTKFKSTRRRTDENKYVYEAEGTYVPTGELLILIGGADDWTPAGFCEELVKSTQSTEHPAQIKVYPGVYHSFDSYKLFHYTASLTNPYKESGKGATTSGDSTAWNDAKIRVDKFFESTLKK